MKSLDIPTYTVKKATGITKAGPSTGLNPTVTNIMQVTCGSRVLQQVWGRWEFPDDTTSGEPTKFALHGNRIYFWPQPAGPLNIQITFTGGGSHAIERPSLNDELPSEFLDLYRRERQRAESDRCAG